MEDQIFRTTNNSIKVVKDSWSKDIAEIRCMLQELVGKMCPTVPRFSLGPSSSMEAEFVKIPRFNGDDPAAWVFQVEQYFTHYNIFSDHKLSLASLYLDGEALNWYCWLFQNKQLTDWDHFVVKLFIRFRTQSREVPDRRLALLRQLTKVNSATRTTTTPSGSTMDNSPSSHYWNVSYDHNNQTFAHKVFGEKPEKKTGNVGEMETILQTQDAMRPRSEYNDTPLQVKTECDEILITRAKQEICNSNEISNSKLDDNKEDPLPLVIAIVDINVRRGKPLHTETSAEVIENKQQNLFGVYPQKTRQYYFDKEVIDSLWERSDPLILDGTRLMHKPIFIHFPFDPGESIPPFVMFGNLNIYLAISHYLSIALYSSVFVLNGTMKGGKLFNGISSSKVGVQTSQPRLPRPLPKSPFSALLLDFLAQVEQFVEIAKEFNFNGFVMIGGVDSKTYARVVATKFNNKLQHAASALATMLQEWKVLKSRSENKVKLQAVHPTPYTIYGVIEIVKLVTRQGLVALKRSDGERAYKNVHQYFKVDNFSSDGSDHVKEYCLYHISNASEASFNHSSTRDDILDIPLFDINTYILACYVSMSFGREGIEAKKELKNHLSYIHELLLVNIIRIPRGDTSNATKLKAMIYGSLSEDYVVYFKKTFVWPDVFCNVLGLVEQIVVPRIGFRIARSFSLYIYVHFNNDPIRVNVEMLAIPGSPSLLEICFMLPEVFIENLRVPLLPMLYHMARNLRKTNVFVLNFSEKFFYESVIFSSLVWLYLNLEDKVLISGGSIVVNTAGQIVGPEAKLQRGPKIRQPNQPNTSFSWNPG